MVKNEYLRECDEGNEEKRSGLVPVFVVVLRPLPPPLLGVDGEKQEAAARIGTFFLCIFVQFDRKNSSFFTTQKKRDTHAHTHALSLSVLLFLLRTIRFTIRAHESIDSTYTRNAFETTKRKIIIMAEEEEEELLDYEEEDVAPAEAAKAASNKASKASDAAGKKKGYVGMHSTGFRDFLLKPELLRAIVDCGFEHPSEGEREFLKKLGERNSSSFILLFATCCVFPRTREATTMVIRVARLVLLFFRLSSE